MGLWVKASFCTNNIKQGRTILLIFPPGFLALVPIPFTQPRILLIYLCTGLHGILGRRQAKKYDTCPPTRSVQFGLTVLIFIYFNMPSTHVFTLMNMTYPILGEGSFWESLFLKLQLRNLFCDRPRALPYM